MAMHNKFDYARRRGITNLYCPTQIEEQDNGGYVAEIAHVHVTFDSDGAAYPELGRDYYFSGKISGSISRKEKRLERSPHNHNLRQQVKAMRDVNDMMGQLRKGEMHIDEANDILRERSIIFRDAFMSGEEIGDLSPSEVNVFLNIPSYE